MRKRMILTALAAGAIPTLLVSRVGEINALSGYKWFRDCILVRWRFI